MGKIRVRFLLLRGGLSSHIPVGLASIVERSCPLVLLATPGKISHGYQEASWAQKTLLLDTVVAATGYAHKYAIGLLNQAPEGKRTIVRRRLPRYG